MSALPASFFYNSRSASARREALIRRDALVRRQADAAVNSTPGVSPHLVAEVTLIGRLLRLRRAGRIRELVYATEGRYRIGGHAVSLDAIRVIVERLERVEKGAT